MTSVKSILVTGSNGQLGMELKDISTSYPDFEFIFVDRNSGSINDTRLFEKIFNQNKPDYLINCAAYTMVDKAEEEKEIAFDINGKSVGGLALLCQRFNTKFIHISTDYVFNGKIMRPLKEDEKTDPVNAYGDSKLLGEILAMENNPDSLIIRTSWVYSFYGKNFVKTMMRFMHEKQELNVVNDQTGSPTYAKDLAETIMKIITANKWHAGIYHFSNDGIINWFEFATEIKKQISAKCVIHPVTSDQYPTPAKRPAFSVMDKSKIIDTYQIQLKDWKQSLKECIDRINPSAQ